GGYPGRIFLNVRGRERDGLISRQDYEIKRDELAEKIKAIRTPEGEPMQTEIYFTKDSNDSNQADLTVYFDNLNFRSAGTVGHNSLFLRENDTGPDDAVHAKEGIFILFDPGSRQKGQRENLRIFDVAPTILNKMGVQIPEGIQGKVIE
ncbi:hypothetical protein ACFL1I_03275, partial [Candidatus Omnitrophota bacterium]